MPESHPAPQTKIANTPDGARHPAPDGGTPRQHPTPPLGRVQMVIVCLALLLEGMSSSSINVQVAAIQRDLALTSVELQTVASAFLLSYAGLLPVAGRLVDSWNRRSVFLIGVTLFGVGCIACALSNSALLLGAGRLIQGAGAALSAPAALALITTGLGETSRRNSAIALYGAMGAVGFSLGLVLPGGVVAMLGWRASFLLFVPIVLLVLVATWTIRSASAQGGQRVGVVNSLLFTVALFASMHLLGAFAGLPPVVVIIEALGIAVLVAVLVVRRSERLFPAAVIGAPHVLAACIGLAGVFAGVTASMYVLSLGLAARNGADAFFVGLLILPQPLLFSLLSGTGARLITRFGSGPAFLAGTTLLILSLVYLGVMGTSSSLEVMGTSSSLMIAVLPAMAGVGAALALCFPAASIAAINATPERYRGTAASLLTTSQNVGGSIGLAVVTLLAFVPATDNSVEVRPGMYVSASAILVGIALAGIPLAAAHRRRRSARIVAP